MIRYEYKVVPAPNQGRKGKGARSVSDRFALALQTVMNELGQDGWEYLRTDTLPCEERQGITGRVTTYQNMLVFRRAASEQAPQMAAPMLQAVRPSPVVAAPRAVSAQSAAQPEPERSVPMRDSRTDAAAAAAAALHAYRMGADRRDMAAE